MLDISFDFLYYPPYRVEIAFNFALLYVQCTYIYVMRVPGLKCLRYEKEENQSQESEMQIVNVTNGNDACEGKQFISM